MWCSVPPQSALAGPEILWPVPLSKRVHTHTDLVNYSVLDGLVCLATELTEVDESNLS